MSPQHFLVLAVQWVATVALVVMFAAMAVRAIVATWRFWLG